MKRTRKILILLSVFASLSLGSLAVSVFTSPDLMAAVKDRYQDLQLFTKVLNLVQQYYVEEVDTQKLIHGGIKGMLQELDPHTNFLPPEIYKEFETETSGEFGGIGIEITLQNDILTVISPIEDTPAWEAGIQAGDKIVEINGDSTKGLSLAEAAQKMRGKKGSKVRLGIFREGFEKPKEYSIARATVKVKSVKFTDLEEGFAYIRLTSFIENSAQEIEKALRKIQTDHKSIKGIIVDVRRNPGGLLDQAIKISDLFLEKGIIVSTMGRNKREKELVYAKKEGTYSGFPMIVLVNEYSASASEILAGALQDNKRALIMGQRSFGKGSVQSVVKLGDAGLKLTVARYYTPSGKSIQAEGIRPDVILEDVDSEAYKKAIIRRDIRREQDISGHLLGEKEQKEKAEHKDKPTEKIHTPNDEIWWLKEGAAKKKNLSPREKLLTEDFQAMQAYNYLKAWRVMESFGALTDKNISDAPFKAEVDIPKVDGAAKEETKSPEKGKKKVDPGPPPAASPTPAPKQKK